MSFSPSHRKRWSRSSLAFALGLCATLINTPPAQALRLKLESTLKIRHLVTGPNGTSMDRAAILAPESVIEIPDQFKTLRNGKIDVSASLHKWMARVGGDKQEEFFFPLRVVSAGAGSDLGTLKVTDLNATPHFAALGTLAKVGRLSVPSQQPPASSSEANSLPFQALVPLTTESPELPSRLEAALPCPGGCTEVRPTADAGALPLATLSGALASSTLVSANAAAKPTLLPVPKTGGRKMSAQCSNLMDANGNFGEWGQSLASIIQEDKYRESFLADKAMGSFCPKFNSLSPELRLKAQVWFWTALAHEESSCSPQKVHATWYTDRQGVRRRLNPTPGYGLWAMEKSANQRRWRGEACKEIGTVAGQARCSVDIMQKVHYNKGRPTSVSRGSYWGPIHRGERQIMPHMRRFKECFQ